MRQFIDRVGLATKSNSRRRRVARIIVWLGGGLFLCTVMALRAFAGMFAKFDNPARLESPVNVTVTNGYTLRWVEKAAPTNSGLDIVFVHGTPGGAGIWASQFKTPFPGANLFAYDRPGFGGSKPARAQPHLEEQVDALMTLLAVATTNRVWLVGHSYGSPIVLLAALEHPEKVRGALLIGGDVDPAQEKPWVVQYLAGWRLVSWVLPRNLRQCNRELLTVRADLELLQARLPKLAVPVMMLHGDKDQMVPVENVAWLRQQLFTLGKTNYFASRIVPEYNHFIPWEHPQDVEQAIHRLIGMETSSP